MTTRIRALLAEKEISISALAVKMGVSQAAVSKMLVGNPKPETIRKIAAALGVPAADLMDPDLVPGMIRLPIICKIAAGNPTLACDCDHGFIDVPARDARNAALIKIKGDSMTPYLLNGDVVLVKLDPTPEPGRVVVARKNLDGELTIKRFKKVGEMFFLQPENPAFDPIVFDPREEWQLVGYVKKLIEREIK